MTTKEQIIEAANRKSVFGGTGSFVNIDGKWGLTRTPAQFKKFLEETYGFTVISCKETKYSTAIAQTACGLEIAWNGHCRKI